MNAQPNPAHLALAKLEKAGKIETVITQNFDGLHQKAGSTRVLEVHGSFRTFTCIRCYQKYRTDSLETNHADGFMESYLKHGTIPLCLQCGGTLKPDVILFEEQLPVQTWIEAQQACRKCDLLLIVGSSLEVMPVAGLPMRALENGAPLVSINRTPTYLDVRAEVTLRSDIAEILPPIVEAVLR
jgi:NAD-dependent deacetylase